MSPEVTFEKGDTLWVEVIECFPDGAVLVSCRGHLFRVRNETGRSWKKSDRVQVLVVRENPLELQLPNQRTFFRKA